MTVSSSAQPRSFLALVERARNMLPEPAMIFVYLIIFLKLFSTLAAKLGWSASVPYSGEEAPQWATLGNGLLTYSASSLFIEENIGRLLTEMPRTLTGFAPLGVVLVVVFGAAVAERVGLFSALIRTSLRSAPQAVLRCGLSRAIRPCLTKARKALRSFNPFMAR